MTAEVRHLGLVVREAVTNVLRHSRATEADLALERIDDRIRISVTNDGVDHESSRSGGGLHQLAVRLRAAGGELNWRRDDDRFRLDAELPSPAEEHRGSPT